MKKTLLACTLLATSLTGFAQDIDFTFVIRWDHNHSSGHGSVCNRAGFKAGAVNATSFKNLTGKLGSQTDLLRKVLAREAYIFTPNGNIIVAELEKRACRDVRFELACKRAVNFEEKADTIGRKYEKYSLALSAYRAASGGFNHAEDARLSALADTAHSEATLLANRLDEKIRDLRELKMSLQAATTMESIEINRYKSELIAQVDSRMAQERTQVTQAQAKATRLFTQAQNYAPVSNRAVRLAKKELGIQVQLTVDEYLLLKKIVKKNERLSEKRISVPGNHPKNSYDNEMRCVSNVFDEIVEDVRALPVQ
ncbi:MAG: hypothetical protein HOE90_03025 [Bacteriovoracaceae bacterium]|jgi:hypothetical protein|nr:hypothetical protein [Bacteriovoracaceae bacterium]